jgi:hypothetical protein
MRLTWLPCVLLAGCFHKTVVEVLPPPPLIAVDDGGYHDGTVAGRWVGHGFQYNNNTSWDIDMSIGVDGRVAGTIDYPGVGCSGELVHLRNEGPVLVVREQLTRNPGNICVDGGTIRMVMRADAAMDWRWYYEGGNEGASAVMSRR